MDKAQNATRLQLISEFSSFSETFPQLHVREYAGQWGSSVSYLKRRVRFQFCSTLTAQETRNVWMPSYRVILLFAYLVPLQPYRCRLWFLSAVKLNLISSGLDDGSPRETRSKDSNEPLIRTRSSLSGLTLRSDTNDKMLLKASRGIWHGGWAACERQCSDCRGWPLAGTLPALPPVFLTACREPCRESNPHPRFVPSVMVEVGLSATGTTFTQLQPWLSSHPL